MCSEVTVLSLSFSLSVSLSVFVHSPGTAKVINRKQDGSNGTMYKIVPMTTDNVTNQITCFKVEGDPDAPVVPQGVLPNATLYQVSMYVHVHMCIYMLCIHM